MTAAANKTVVRRVVEEVINTGNLAVADELVDTSFVDHTAPADRPPGLAGFKQAVARCRSVFHQFDFTIEDLIAEGDQVVIRGTLRATRRDERLGRGPIRAGCLSPSIEVRRVAGVHHGGAWVGVEFALTRIDVVRIAGGKIVERWGQAVVAGLPRGTGAARLNRRTPPR